MDNYLPADFHALRDLIATDQRDFPPSRNAQRSASADARATGCRPSSAESCARGDRFANDCIDPGWLSL